MSEQKLSPAPELFREYPNGQNVYIWNPIDECPDSEQSPQYRFRSFSKGVSPETGAANAASRCDALKAQCRYQVYIPCIRCANCIVIQELERGQYANNSYFCHHLKGPVDRFGTCDQAAKGKLGGPCVIQRDKTMEEILANKESLMN